MKRTTSLFATLLAAAALASCGGGTKGTPDNGNPDNRPLDVGYDQSSDEGDRDVPADNGCAKTLNYVDAMEFPVEGYHLQLTFNGDRDLKVKVTACDAAVANEWITFTETQDDKNLCVLEVEGTTTGEDGIASVKITSPQEDQEGDCKVKACRGEDCLIFNIWVKGKALVPLVVGFETYGGQYPQVNSGTVFIYKNQANGKPNCADIPPDNTSVTATAKQGPISLQTTAQFPTLPNLEEGKETSQTYTVRCFAAEGTTGTSRAYGCVDDVHVELGARTFVECPLKDIPPKLVGSYDITSTFDMVSGLPPNVALVVNHIIGFFESPTGEVMMLMCDPAIWKNGSQLQDLCNYVFSDPAHPAIDQLSSIGEIVRQIVDALLVGLLASNCPYPDNPDLCTQIYFTGKDVGDILKKFTLQSTMTCTQEPDVNGLVPMGGCREVWHTVILRWTLGKDCPPTDDQCGAISLSLSSLPGIEDTITADIEATISANGTKLAIAKHKVNLKYGALVDFALEKILLPQIFGDGSDGLPAVDSFEAMIGSLLAGKACLQNYTCCEEFAANVVGQTGGVLAQNLVEGACDALITTGATYVRGFLTDLDATPDNFSLGTPADNPCSIYDTNKDMRYDALGKKTDPCVWDATLTIGTYEYGPDGTFYGSRQ
jgi:hypothetical protein